MTTSARVAAPDALVDLSLELAREVSTELWAAAGTPVPSSGSDVVRRRAQEAARRLLVAACPDLGEDSIALVVERAVAATVGAGAIEECLADESVTEVMVNGPMDVRVERAGRLETTGLRYIDAAHLEEVAQRLMGRVGRRVDRSSPVADGRLPDGSRVHVVLPPVAVGGPFITVRRLRHRLRSLPELLAACGADQKTGIQLRALVESRANVLVAGGTGSGKTTWVATLLDLVEQWERIVVIEDALELPLRHPHAVRLEARPPSVDGSSEVSIRDLVRAALRMRPDRLIIGEVRGPEAFDLVQALHTGHRGSWSTLHANSPDDALERLVTLAALADVGVPEPVLMRQARRSVDAIVQLDRCPDGTRKISEIRMLDRRAHG